MRQIFIGLFILAFLAGVVGKVMNDSKDKTSVVGHFLNFVGFKQREKMQRAQMDKIVHQFALQKEGTSGYLHEQQEAVTSSKVLMGSLSQLLQDRMDRDTNMDLLRLKDLMRRYQDKSALLIEHGQQIADFNEKQWKVNQKMAEEADKASFISNDNRIRFLNNIQTGLDQQNNLMDQQRIDARELQDHMQQILDQVHQMQSDVSFKENTELVQKLQAVSDKTRSALEKAEAQKQKLEEINEKNKETIRKMKEKTEEMQQKTFDSIAQSRKNVPDETKLLNDRLRDKLDRMQDQRIK